LFFCEAFLFSFYVVIFAFEAKEIDAVKPIKIKINTHLATEI